jgi:HAD superfamily hydrolase (TIGR01549 family)
MMFNSTQKLAELSAIFFDLDGTLVTSYLDFAKIRKEINYPVDVDILTHLAALPPHEAERIEKILVRHELDDANKAQALEGAAELLAFCQQQSWPTVVVTRNSRAMAELKLNKAGLRVDVLISREDAPAKPDPTAILEMLSKYQLKADEVMYLGDYIYDIQTARNAGLIAGLIDHHQELAFADQADIVVNNLSQLQQQIVQAKSRRPNPQNA